MQSLTLLQRVETVLDGWVSVKAILRTASSIFYFFSRTFLFWTIWCCVSTEHGINLPQIFLSLTKHHLFWSNGSFFCIFRIHLPFPLFRFSGDLNREHLNSEHLNNELALIRYSDACIQMVFGIQMEFEYWTIRRSDNFQPSEYWTNPVFRSPLY